jgi:ferredoxin-NADP reductase
MDGTSNAYLLRISKIITETPDTKSFVLEEINKRKINYTAGQFLTFLFGKNNNEEDRRNYSISSIPSEVDPLMITVKRIPNGEYSRRLIDNAKEGDELYTIGASGFFILPDDMDCYDQFIFFAAGSGITPVYALIKTLLQDHPSKKVLLVYSNRSIEYSIFYKELRQLQKANLEKLKIEFLFSNATSVTNRRLGIYVLEKILEKYITNPLKKHLFYLCGPFEYMRTITIVLKNNGIPASHIRKEIFTVEKPKTKPEPDDKSLHSITATLNNIKYRFDMKYPETILESAKKLQIPLPYSCEAGQCGTCAATCVSGKVWMWRNDVLLDEEIAKGRVLTCTGYAMGGDVRLEF